MRRTIISLVILFTSVCALAQGVQPMDALQKAIEHSISILKDPRYREVSQRDTQEEELWAIARRSFDFQEFSRRVLGRYWENYTLQQRREFTDIFTRFLRVTYIPLVQEKYTNERVIFRKQKLITDSKAVVKIKVVWKGLGVPVNCYMQKREGMWMVYDVTILGISAVSNYQAQLRSILRNGSPEQLIELMKKKAGPEMKDESQLTHKQGKESIL